MCWSGKKLRREGGKMKPWDQCTGFALWCMWLHIGTDKRCFQNFSTWDANVHERSFQTPTANKSDYWSIFSHSHFPCIIIWWQFGGLGNKTSKQTGSLIWRFGLCLQGLSSIWGMLLWNSCFQRHSSGDLLGHLPQFTWLSIMGTNLSQEGSFQNTIWCG